jgi:membrane protease YdiL (CAAX protease family)
VSATIERYQLAVFLVGSIAVGSLATWALAELPVSPVIMLLAALPISYLPAALAWLMLRIAGDAEERRAFGRRLRRWRIGLRWYVVGIVLVPAAHLVGVALATLGGGVFPVHLERLGLLPLLVITNVGEEVGWRGYGLPRLQRRFSALTSSVILGGVWAAFHWVALGHNPSRPLSYLAVGTVSLVAMSVVMTWLFNRTGGSVVLMVAVHAMYDVVSIGVVPLVDTRNPLLAFTLSGILLCLIAVVLMLLDGPQFGGSTRHSHGISVPTRTLESPRVSPSRGEDPSPRHRPPSAEEPGLTQTSQGNRPTT